MELGELSAPRVKRSHAFNLCECSKVSNTITRLAVGRPTLAVSPQNGTKSDLRRSEIENLRGGTCFPRATHPSTRFARFM